MIGAAHRTVNDLNYHMAIINIFKTYILPVILYGSTIWNQNRIGYNSEIIRLFRKVTRIALRTPYDTSHRNYIPFPKRSHVLHLNSLEIHLQTHAANLASKKKIDINAEDLGAKSHYRLFKMFETKDGDSSI